MRGCSGRSLQNERIPAAAKLLQCTAVRGMHVQRDEQSSYCMKLADTNRSCHAPGLYRHCCAEAVRADFGLQQQPPVGLSGRHGSRCQFCLRTVSQQTCQHSSADGHETRSLMKLPSLLAETRSAMPDAAAQHVVLFLRGNQASCQLAWSSPGGWHAVTDGTCLQPYIRNHPRVSPARPRPGRRR